MRSVRSVYKVGHGPSSSHTVGPYRAAREFRRRYPEADAFQVTLFGSLAFTGAGHGTMKAIRSAIPNAEVNMDTETQDLPHPNTMLFTALKDGKILAQIRAFSIGGGSVRFEGEENSEERELYPEKTFSEILENCRKSNLTIPEFVYSREEPDFREYLREIWHAMRAAVERGLQ